MGMDFQRLEIDSDGAGAVADIYTKPFQGLLRGVYLELGTLASGAVDIVITDDFTGAAILTITNAAASGWYVPTLATHDASGTGALYAGGGSAVRAPVPVAGILKVATTAAGNDKLGAISFYVGG